MKNSIIFLLVALPMVSFAQKPIMLDDIHYYTPQRKTTVDWFMNNFGAKPMAEVSSNPLTFITFLQISQGQSTINVSPPGPFPGVKVGDPKRWEKEAIAPSKELPPMYGVHWIAMSTPSLKESLKSLNSNGVENGSLPENFRLGNKKSSKLALIWGPDYNRILLVEHKKTVGSRIDHLLLLVADLAANLKFFQEVLAADILEQGDDFARIQVAKHEFILAKPAYVGLKDEEVIKRHPKKFTPNIDHLGFLYANQEDLKLAFQKATNAGYQILMPPKRMDVFDKPTPYVFGILFSPDGLQIELETEDGRTGPRTKYQTVEPLKEN